MPGPVRHARGPVFPAPVWEDRNVRDLPTGRNRRGVGNVLTLLGRRNFGEKALDVLR